jgi:tripartite-type tricarboxylate transporter receptor subunit TctC
MIPRRALPFLLAGLAAPAVARGHRAVELLVGAAPGSAADRWTRGMAPFLERHLPRLSVAVRNQGGRGGLDAVAALSVTPPESKTLGVLTTPLVLVRAIEAGEPSPLTRLSPLGSLVEEPVVLVAGASGPADLAALRALGDRGVVGTPPPGTAAHLASQRLDGRLALPVLAFPSAAAARQAAQAGHVAAAVLGLPDAVSALRDGKLVGLGLAAPRRSPALPELPTLREQGVDLVALAQRGLAVPPATPESWRGTVLAALGAVSTDPDFVAQCEELGQTPRLLGPEPWQALLGRVDAELRRRWAEDPWLPRRA